MAKQETIELNFSCKNCEKNGKVTIGENLNPMHGGYGLNVKSITDGFYSKIHNHNNNLSIFCSNCNTEIYKY